MIMLYIVVQVQCKTLYSQRTFRLSTIHPAVPSVSCCAVLQQQADLELHMNLGSDQYLDMVLLSARLLPTHKVYAETFLWLCEQPERLLHDCCHRWLTAGPSHRYSQYVITSSSVPMEMRKS